MYLRKSSGPRCVTLPTGERMSRADLPDPGTRRWVVGRKALVAKAILGQLITRHEALELYNLSDEELDSWINALVTEGIPGLKVTRSRRNGQL